MAPSSSAQFVLRWPSALQSHARGDFERQPATRDILQLTPTSSSDAMASAGATIEHFLWMRKDFREDQEYALVAWDMPGSTSKHAVYSLRGPLHACNGVMRTLSGLPARTLSFSWNDTAEEATAVFVETDAAVLVFVFRGSAASSEFAQTVDATLDAIAVLAGPAALHREGAAAWDLPLVAQARLLLVTRHLLVAAAAAGRAPLLHLPLLANAPGFSSRGPPSPFGARSPLRAPTSAGSFGSGLPAPASTSAPGTAAAALPPPPPSLSAGSASAPPPLTAASLAADTELTVLESDVNDAFAGPLQPLLPAAQSPTAPAQHPHRSSFAGATSDLGGGRAAAGSPAAAAAAAAPPALLRSRPPPTLQPAGGHDAPQQAPGHTTGGRGPPSAGSAAAASAAASSSARGVLAEWFCTGSAVCVVPPSGPLTRLGGASPLPNALASRLRPSDEADVCTLLGALRSPPSSASPLPLGLLGAAAPLGSAHRTQRGTDSSGGGLGFVGSLAAEAEAVGRGFEWHWPPSGTAGTAGAHEPTATTAALTRGRSARGLSVSSDATAATSSAGAAAAAAGYASSAARAITRIRLVALPVAAFVRLASGGASGGAAAAPSARTPLRRPTHGSTLDALRQRSPVHPGDPYGQRLLLPLSPGQGTHPQQQSQLLPLQGGRREAPGVPVRPCVALWAARVAFWRPADKSAAEWPDVTVPPPAASEGPAAAAPAPTASPRGGGASAAPPAGSALARPLFAPLPLGWGGGGAPTAAAPAVPPPAQGSRRAASGGTGSSVTPRKSSGGGGGASFAAMAAAAPAQAVPGPTATAPAATPFPSPVQAPPGLGQVTKLVLVAALDPQGSTTTPSSAQLLLAPPGPAPTDAAAPPLETPIVAAAVAGPPPSAGPSLLLVVVLERRGPMPWLLPGVRGGQSASAGPFDAILAAAGPLLAKCLRRIAREKAVAAVAEAVHATAAAAATSPGPGGAASAVTGSTSLRGELQV